MAVTQTDNGPSLKLIAQAMLQSGRRVGITQLTKTLKEWMGEFRREPEDSLGHRITLVIGLARQGNPGL